MNQINEIIDTKSLTSRTLNLSTMSDFFRNNPIYHTWRGSVCGFGYLGQGSEMNYIRLRIYRGKHKGYVYIFHNFSYRLDVYFTKLNDTIVSCSPMMGISKDELIDYIDSRVRINQLELQY